MQGYSPTTLKDLRDLVDLSAAIYTPAGVDTVFDVAGVYFGIKDLDEDRFAIVFRGSEILEDWLRDMEALPTNHPTLGPVVKGFFKGLEECLPVITREIVARHQKRLLITGHSLGAARALLMGGLAWMAGLRPDFIAAFAPPKPGCQRLADVLDGIEVYSFRNRLDPVPTLPFPRSTFPVVQPRGLIALNQPAPVLEVGATADHHVALYRAGIHSLQPSP